MVLWSRSTKQVVLLELTVPWETRIAEAHERKLAKYTQLLEECQQNKWKAVCFPIEVGCRGFPAQSFWRAMGALGLTGAKRKKLAGLVARRAEEASWWVWRKREEEWKR